MKYKIQLWLIVVAVALTACRSGSGSDQPPALNGDTPPPVDLPIDEPPVVGDNLERMWRIESFGLAAADEITDDVFIATDYVFDDRGANTGGTAGGNYSYPSSEAPYNNNAADIVELRLFPVRSSQVLLVGVRLNTLLDTSVPVIAVGLDNGTTPTLNEEWPFEPGVHAMGVRYVLTLQGDDAVLTDLSTGENTVLPMEVRNGLPAAQSYLENTFTVEIPFSALGTNHPPSGAWQLYTIAGLWDDDAWFRPAEGVAAPYDIGFVEEEFSGWQDARQADMLADGDITLAGITVDFREFPERAAPRNPGLQTRIYRSPVSHIVGEGWGPWNWEVNETIGEIDSGGNHYRGLYLPYMFWVPEHIADIEPPYPLFAVLHGLSQTHIHSVPEYSNGTMNYSGLTAFPLIAGESTFGRAEGEIDVLSVIEDVKARYDVDDDRVFLSGLSMGGQAAYNIATHYPDLFAAVIPLISTGQALMHRDAPIKEINEMRFTTERWQGSFGRELMLNLYNVPLRKSNGLLDPIVNPTWPLQDLLRAIELGNDAQLSMFATGTHGVKYPHLNALFHALLHDCKADNSPPACIDDQETAPVVRDINPARVAYKTTPHHFFPDLGLIYEGAYWVSGMVVRQLRNTGDSGIADITSYGLAPKLREDVEEFGPEQRTFQESQVGGFSMPTPEVYTYHGQRQLATPGTPEPRMTANLENLSAVTVDMARAGLTTFDEDVIVSVDTDGITVFSLSELAPGTSVSLNGTHVSTADTGGVVAVTLHQGAHEIVVTR